MAVGLLNHEISIRMDEATEVLLKSVKRAEDVQISPNGKMLAIADIKGNQIVLFSIAFAEGEAILSRGSRVVANDILAPHGLAWIGENLLAVANRGGMVTFHRIDDLKEGINEIPSVFSISGEQGHLIEHPGSILYRKRSRKIFEIFICNNFSDMVSQHLFSIQDGEISILEDRCLLFNDFKTPDGFALSKGEKTLFVSDHLGKRVLAYEFGNFAPGAAKGEIVNCAYPHGLVQHPQTGTLFIAGAGERCIHVVKDDGSGWRSITKPCYTFEMMSMEQFLPTHINIEDGGPKGITITPGGRYLVVSSQARPLSIFDVDSILNSAGIDRVADEVSEVDQEYGKRYADTIERTIGYLKYRVNIERNLKSKYFNQLMAMRNSISMRVTLPMRLLSRAIKKMLGQPVDYEIEN